MTIQNIPKVFCNDRNRNEYLCWVLVLYIGTPIRIGIRRVEKKKEIKIKTKNKNININRQQQQNSHENHTRILAWKRSSLIH